MANKISIPALLLLGAGLVFAFGDKLPSIDTTEWKSPFSQVAKVDLAGTHLLLIHEKKYPSVDEVLAVRAASQFVADNKMTGFLDIDKDDPWIKPLLDQIGEKYKTLPPLLAAAEVKDGAVVSIKYVRPWKTGLGDLLK